MRVFIFLTAGLMLMFTLTVRAQESGTPDDTPADTTFLYAHLTYSIIDGVNGTFGYDIYMEGRKMIHQPNIPALPGSEGFRTREEAARIAELVIGKIRKGIMPPTVTVEELSPSTLPEIVPARDPVPANDTVQ